jgi:hypothetical protein
MALRVKSKYMVRYYRTVSQYFFFLILASPSIAGPTSLSYIVHSIPSLGGARGLDSFDLRHNTTWEVGKSGDGFIQIHEPISSSSQSSSRSIEPRMEREVLERLVNSYFKSIAPIFPVVIESEFLSGPSPPLVLLYAICCVAATARDVPLRVFDSLRMATNALLKSEDVLSTASMVNVQVLLVLGMCEDVYSKAVPKASSAAWLRVSTVRDYFKIIPFSLIELSCTVGNTNGPGSRSSPCGSCQE